MPRQHYRCEDCGVLILLTYRAADTDDPQFPGPHAECGGRLVNEPQRGDFAMDAKSDGGTDKGFQKFYVWRTVPTKDGPRQERVEVDSLHKLRQIEKDSEQRYKDGEGEPLRFRMWNQNGSNRDVNSFGASGQIGTQSYHSGEQPTKKKNIGVKRHGQEKPKIPLGPGVAKRGATPLKG